MMEGGFFLCGLAFLDTTTVIPVFIHTFTGSLQLAGLANTLKIFAPIIPQLLIGPHIAGLRDIPRFVTLLMLWIRPLPILMVPVLFAGWDPFLTVGIFLVLFTGLWACDGIVALPWLDLFARVIPSNTRGKLIGYQQLIGGVGSITAGFIIKFTLQHPDFSNPVKYAIIFGLSGFLLIIAGVAMSYSRDLNRELHRERVNYIQYYRRIIGSLTQNYNFRRMLLIQIVSQFTGMMLPFVILFGKETFHFTDSAITTLIYIQIVGSLAAGLVWGGISHYLGNKYVILVSQITALILSGLALCSFIPLSFSPFLLFIPMALLVGINAGAWLGFLNYTIDLTGKEEDSCAPYFVLVSLLTLPFTSLSYFAGLAAEHWGFIPIFILAFVAALVALLLSIGLHSLTHKRTQLTDESDRLTSNR